MKYYIGSRLKIKSSLLNKKEKTYLKRGNSDRDFNERRLKWIHILKKKMLSNIWHMILNLEKQRLNNEQQRFETKQSFFDLKMQIKEMDPDFKLNKHKEKQKQPFYFQKDMNEQQLRI
jgi:hypothetical protein